MNGNDLETWLAVVAPHSEDNECLKTLLDAIDRIPAGGKVILSRRFYAWFTDAVHRAALGGLVGIDRCPGYETLSRDGSRWIRVISEDECVGAP